MARRKEPDAPEWLVQAYAKGLVVEGVGVQTAALPGSVVAPPDPRLPDSEDAFMDRVAGFAQANGWLVFHPDKGRRGKKYVTPVRYDGKGFPDLVMVRDRVVFAELKCGRNTTTPEQKTWLGRLAGFVSRKVVVKVWYPADWREIEEVLT